tara:strand:- start:1430 stop:2122 length:693 start_codon:yes stop_codon:yes gene_type:complete
VSRDNPLQSADSKYYASKQPLNLNGTREGRKNPKKSFSYKQKGSDVTASSDKYYASPEQAAPSKAPIAAKKELILRYKASDKVLQDVVGGFQEGGTLLEIVGDQDEIRKARAAIDMAVGRNTLTREQANAIKFITLTFEPLVADTPEPVKKKATKKKTTKKKTTRKKAKKNESLGGEADPLIESLLTDNLSDETKGEVLKNGWKDADDITEKDVAAAFGVSDDDDDDSDD